MIPYIIDFVIKYNWIVLDFEAINIKSHVLVYNNTQIFICIYGL